MFKNLKIIDSLRKRKLKQRILNNSGIRIKIKLKLIFTIKILKIMINKWIFNKYIIKKII